MTLCSLAQRAQTGIKGVDRQERANGHRGVQRVFTESHTQDRQVQKVQMVTEGQKGTERADRHGRMDGHGGDRQAWRGWVGIERWMGVEAEVYGWVQKGKTVTEWTDGN